MRARNQFTSAVATTPELSALLLRASDKGITLDADELQRFNSLMWGLFNLFEDSMVQHDSGLLTPESWETTRWAMTDMLKSSGVRNWVSRNRAGLTSALEAEITSLIGPTED